MNDQQGYACSICGEESPLPRHWFLVAENRWEDKLQILEWNERLAAQPGIHHACATSHVQELVIHWMTTGTLNYPFARVAPWDGPLRRWSDIWAPQPDVDLGSMRPVGELSVHRESIRRVLSEDPNSLKTMLEALSGALQASPDPSFPMASPPQPVLNSKAH